MSIGVSQIDSCDSCDFAVQPDQDPPGRLLAGDREDPVVAPLAVDVEEVRRVADLADAELLHDPQRVGVLGADADLDAVQAAEEEAVSMTIATARGMTPRPANCWSIQ